MDASQNISLEEILNNFVDELLGSLAFADITGEQRELMRELIVNRVDKRLIAMIIQELPEDQFNTILQGVDGKDLTDEDEMAVIAGAIDHIPNFGEKLGQALEALRSELTEDIVELKNSSSN